MPSQVLKRLRRVVMSDLQRACKADPDWKTLSASEKLQRRVSKVTSFERHELGFYLDPRAGMVRKRLRAISVRAEEGWLSDLATLVSISFEATRMLNRLARRDPLYVKKVSSILGSWPLLCKNQARLSLQQLKLLDEIGIAKPGEFRIGSPQTPNRKGIVSKEAEFIFLWMLDFWKNGHLIGEQNGSATALQFLEDKIWPRWYVKQRSHVVSRLNEISVRRYRPIKSALKKVHHLPPYTDKSNHAKWSKAALDIYTATTNASIELATGKTGNPQDSASEQRSKRRGLFKKNFLQLLKGKPGAGRPRTLKAKKE